jgi:predicted transcriptional regulator
MFGRLSVEQGRVLYLDLESTQKRIKKRTMSMLGSRAPWPDNFHIFTEWPQGPEGLTQLEAWLQEYPDTKLIVIDVLASFRRPMDRNDQIYLYDRETVKPINDLCERYSCAALLVHHVNKAKPDDVFDTISGSTGLQSVCNTMWVLSRAADDNAQTVFSIRGRDIENDEPLSLRWDDYASMHVLEGKAAELAVSGERAAILKALDDDEARSPSEIAELVGNSVGNVKRLLGKMLQDNQVDKSGYGKWSRVRGHSRNSGISGNSGNSGISGISGNSSEEIPQELPRVTESYRRDTGDLGLSDAVNRQELPELPELPLQTRILHMHGLWYAFEPDGTVIGPKQSREELNA